MSEQTDMQQGNPAKYCFWLSFIALFLSAIFAGLAYLTFASGTALAGEVDAVNAGSTLLRFDIIGGVFIIMVPVSMFLGWKLRPGGVES